MAYYGSGILFLPLGNFALLPEIPMLYSYCQETQDKDMMPWDFITDHLLCLDRLVDAHDNGDEQKPHHFPPFQTDVAHVMTCMPIVWVWLTDIAHPIEHTPCIPAMYLATYNGELFRPPSF